jgi:hypothetical protein
MKKHLLGFCVALFFAVTSFYVSPIHFTNWVFLNDTKFNGSDESVNVIYSSNHFKKVYVSFANDYKTKEAAGNKLDYQLSNAAEIIEPAREVVLNGYHIRRAVFARNDNHGYSYCISIQNKNYLTNICSASYRHVIEIEQQNPH